MPYFPVSIASNEINPNEVKRITSASTVKAVKKVKLAQSVQGQKFMGQNTRKDAKMSSKNSFALRSQFVLGLIPNPEK